MDGWKIQFSWRKPSRIARFCCAKGRHAPQISWRKLSWIAIKPRNLRKFSPSKFFRYTVCCSHIMIQRIWAMSLWNQLTTEPRLCVYSLLCIVEANFVSQPEQQFPHCFLLFSSFWMSKRWGNKHSKGVALSWKQAFQPSGYLAQLLILNSDNIRLFSFSTTKF